MTRKLFNLERLFEPRKPPIPLYPTIEAELDAIRAGKKQMSIFGPTVQDLVDRDSYYFEILELAFDRGLAVVLHAESTPKHAPLFSARMFVARPDQLWRVPALLAVDEAHLTRGVADEQSRLALELQQSVLLGYTASQCKAFVVRRRQREDGLYVLLTREQKERVIAHGRRCFGTPDDVERMTFFFHRAGRVKANAAAIVPSSLTLARARLRNWDAVFPKKRRAGQSHLLTGQIARPQVQAFNDALYGRIDFMTARGWQ